jgi:lysozyme
VFHIYAQASVKTIGYGHVIKEDEQFSILTQEDATELLLADLKIYELAVVSLINTHLTQSEFDALVSFCFNLGVGALQRSTLRQKINRNEHEDVENEFLRWVYVKGQISKGLINRRKAEVGLYFS